MARSPIALHWFRRDIRLDDNRALLDAHQQADLVVPVFVLDPHLLEATSLGAPRLSFLFESLRCLDAELRRSGSALIVLRGSPEEELSRLALEVGAAIVSWNRDYSPYAMARDARVTARLRHAGVTTLEAADLVLVEPWECVKPDGSPYSVFTPFARRWRLVAKPPPQGRPRVRALPRTLLAKAAAAPLPRPADLLGYELRANIEPAGERQAQKRLAEFLARSLVHYRTRRDLPGMAGTSRLSAHLRFGTISVRTVYAASTRALAESGGSEGEAFLDELCWREFFVAILFHFPHVLKGPFRPSFARFRWPGTAPEQLEAWTEGRTGFPLVDAGMRQLASTGWMHNRLRMVTAMFLTKSLLVDWRAGERVFLQRLTDGDPAANNGGWQWSASTGTDAAPYFRIFNPLAQAKRFDPDGSFVRRFIPEIADLPAPLIHEPWKDPGLAARTGYPRPIVDLAESRARALRVLAPIARRGSRS